MEVHIRGQNDYDRRCGRLGLVAIAEMLDERRSRLRRAHHNQAQRLVVHRGRCTPVGTDIECSIIPQRGTGHTPTGSGFERYHQPLPNSDANRGLPVPATATAQSMRQMWPITCARSCETERGCGHPRSSAVVRGTPGR